jgi:hypothetical protein
MTSSPGSGRLPIIRTDPEGASGASTTAGPTDAKERAMAKYLSQEWLDLYQELAQEFPERPGATAVMQYVVTGAPEGDVSYVQRIENGKMSASQLGDDSDAEFTLTMGYDDAKKIQKGELDANAAFMQGKLKVTGNLGKLMSLMPLTQSQEYKAIQAKLTEQTEFDA